MATPTFVQHVHTGTNSANENGNFFKINLPNPAGAGNCLVLGLSYNFSAGRTFLITDDQGNTWPTTPTVTTNDGGCSTSIFVLLNAAAGTQKIKIKFDTAIQNVQAVLSEFYNVATASAGDGTSGANNVTGPTVASGSITTTVDGDLIYNYGLDSNGGFPANATNSTGFTPGSGFTPLSFQRYAGSFVCWAQYQVQGTHGAINPSITVAAGTHDTQFNSVSVALKAASAGTAPAAGIRVVRIHHVSMTGASPQVIDFPSTGNLVAVAASLARNVGTVSGATDSNSNAYTVHVIGTLSSQIASTDSGATTGASLVITVTGSGSLAASFLVYDIAGASSSPFDNQTSNSGNLNAITHTTQSRIATDTTVTVASGTGIANGDLLVWENELVKVTAGGGTGTLTIARGQNDTTAASHATSTNLFESNFSNAPTITPTTSNGLILVANGLGTGPGIDCTVAGATFDCMAYVGETDNGGNDSADCYAHYYNPNTSAVNFAFNFSNGGVSTGWNALAVAFKAAPAGTVIAVDEPDAQAQRFAQSTRMESQYQQELQDTFGITPPRPAFAFEDDGQNMRWCDWRALQYEEVDVHRALPPIPPFSVEDDAERQKNVTWSAIQYDDTETHRALPPTPPFAIVDEISERPLPGVTPFVEEDQPGKPIIVAPAPNIGLDDIEAHIKASDRVATYYEDDVFNTALAPPIAQQDEISERWAGTFAVHFDEDQPALPIISQPPPPSIEDDMGQQWSATAPVAVVDDWYATVPLPPFAFEDDLRSFTADARAMNIEEDFTGKPPLPPVILTTSDDEASQRYVDWNLGYARLGIAMDDFDSHILPPIVRGPFVLIAALRHATYSALVATGGHTTYSQLQASGGMQFLDGGA